MALTLLTVVGCAALTAAKTIGEAAGADRLHSEDAFARHIGTVLCQFGHPIGPDIVCRAPEIGNSIAALHRIALTQARCHPGARDLLAR
ncbi:hypothetical protein [Nocardia brasiliensis]|uniref:hypothetical protein n=1 Tax=Nocardia brasiliensis TaxID=37326 RepID=UPI00245757EF|nr:hypothetical protein [Nocardia brasiliensis]